MLQQAYRQLGHAALTLCPGPTSKSTPSLAALDDAQALEGESGDEVNPVKTYLDSTPPCADT